jgi:hypothetical protein
MGNFMVAVYAYLYARSSCKAFVLENPYNDEEITEEMK